MQKNLVVFGSSDIIDLVNNSNLSNYKIEQYISKHKIFNFPFKHIKYFGNDKNLSKKKLKNKIIVLNIYNNLEREKIFNNLKKKKIIPKKVLSKNSIFYSNIKIGKCCLVYPNSVLSTNSNIGTGTIISYNVLVGHDVKIGKFCFVSPGSVVLGRVKIGNNCFIGSNVTLMPDVKIGNNVTISSGSVVNKNIKSNSLLINRNDNKIFNAR